jgi:hypothetical protein
MAFKRWGLLCILAFWVFIPYSFGEESETGETTAFTQSALKTNPFELEKNRIVSGTEFKILVNRKLFDESNDKIGSIKLEYSAAPDGKKIVKKDIVSWYFKDEEGDLYLYGKLPSWNKLTEIKKQSPWRGVLSPYRAEIVIDYQKGKNGEGKPDLFAFSIEIPDLKWGVLTGIVGTLLLILLLASGFTRSISPLQLIQNPAKKTISVSKVQIFIWTAITLFGIIYVYRVSATFLEITPQVLVLLGIGGGTAVASKYYAIRNKGKGTVPAEGKDPSKEKAEVQPVGFGNGRSDIFRFQMLSFTLVVAVIVAIEIFQTNAFPVLPDNLVGVMGISNAVYLGHKVSQKDDAG